MTEMATTKQLDYIVALVKDRELTATDVELITAQVPTLTKARASEFITALLNKPKRQKMQVLLPSNEVREGFWVAGGNTYKVQRAVNGSGRLYAKILIGEQWVRSYSGMNVLRKAEDVRELTKEEAAAFGKLYGRCMICSRTLTDEESLSRGMGSVCYNRFGM